jgi:Cu(I)/Ag(I) efflux system membrane fusion protein
MNRIFSLLLIAAIAGGAGWYFGKTNPHSAGAAASAGRKVLFYQSPMHPWIKSDQPGNCTICGMKLVPVYEGDTPRDEHAGAHVVELRPASINVVHVATAPVVRQPLRRTIRVAGTIDDDDTRHRRLSAYVEGRVEALHVNFIGAEVTAGQPLASIYSRELLVARSEYVLAVKGPPAPERDTALAASRQKLRRMGLTLEQIEKLPVHTGDTFDLVAPASGTIVTRNVYPGQYVKEGDVLFEIADFDRMWFVFDAYERDLAWIRTGQPVEIVTPSVPGKIFTAPIDFIDPTLVMDTRSAKVRVVLDNPRVADPQKHRHELLHRTYAEGRIRAETEPVLTVPRTAVLAPGGVASVFVEKEKGYEPRAVTLGRVGDDVWEVVAGLREGERVVTTGNLLLDAQAQFEHGTAAPTATPTAAPALTEAQRPAVRALLEKMAALSVALANDDLAAYNAAAAPARAAVQEAVQQLGERGRQLATAPPLADAADLATARRLFYPASTATTGLATALRRSDPAFRDVHIFVCGMAKTAVPTAETTEGRWIQFTAELRNPYFGAEMIGCGEEVEL